MKRKQIIFILTTVFLSFLLVFMLSKKYDVLSRYAYQNEEARSIIREYLTEDEIEYIVEHSIYYGDFIDYAKHDEFNVFFTEQYNYIRSKVAYLTPDQIVEIYDLTIDTVNVDDLIAYIYEYGYESYLNYFIHGDSYIEGSNLVLKNIDDLNLYLDKDNTILARTPRFLINYKDEIFVDKRILKDYELMCEAMTKELEIENCANLEIYQGYISYDNLVELYTETNDEMYLPGHSNYQLGLVIDIKEKYSNKEKFIKTKQYEWLTNNAYLYGFINENKEEYPTQLRYVGNTLAILLKDNNITLKEYLNGE